VRALLVIAHGSPRPEANGDIERVADVLRARNVYPLVKVCYLSVNEPDIPTAIDDCVQSGATEIDAVPYVLHSGKHLLRDIPEIIDEAARRHRGVTLRIGDYVGHTAAMASVLRDRVREAVRGS
jgi:sirohydrochlorin ferrochelatase